MYHAVKSKYLLNKIYNENLKVNLFVITRNLYVHVYVKNNTIF